MSEDQTARSRRGAMRAAICLYILNCCVYYSITAIINRDIAAEFIGRNLNPGQNRIRRTANGELDAIQFGRYRARMGPTQTYHARSPIASHAQHRAANAGPPARSPRASRATLVVALASLDL